MSMPKVSVVILNAFSLNNLEECLKSVICTDYPNHEIIVVDCLTPDIRTFMDQNYPTVQLIALGEDIGPAAMHNTAMDNCDRESRYVAFLDNDTVVEKDWLMELVQCIDKDDTIGAVQAKILLFHNPHILNTSGNKSNYLAVGWPDGFGEGADKGNHVKEITFPSGAGMIMRRNALEMVGMYDQDYFIYADDLDVGLRLRLAGYRILYCPTSRVYHKYKFLKNARNFYYLNRNRITTFLKIYNWNTYIILSPTILFFELSLIGYAVINGFTNELMKSYVHNIRAIPAIIGKRAAIRKYKKISDKELLETFEGTIDFSEFSGHPYVKFVLNPILKHYRDMLVRFILVK